MKSGIVSRRDPYLMDPSLMVDPNLILDYGSSFKDETCNPYNLLDPLMDLLNCNDTQLEKIILDSGLCGECVDNPWQIENDFDLDEILNDKVQPSEIEAQTQAELEALNREYNQEFNLEMNVCSINESDIANYEEVYACETEDADSVCGTSDVETADNESVHSFCTESSVYTVKENTPKRKLSNDKSNGSIAPKRRKTTRRNKRVQDDRVKNQNKVAAMKYRKKKRDEKNDLDDIVEIEEERNKKLKAEAEELKVNIDVLKELLGKYLSPSQLKMHK